MDICIEASLHMITIVNSIPFRFIISHDTAIILAKLVIFSDSLQSSYSVPHGVPYKTIPRTHSRDKPKE